MKTAFQIMAVMLTVVGRAGEPCRYWKDALLVQDPEPRPQAPGLLASLKWRANAAPLASKQPSQRR